MQYPIPQFIEEDAKIIAFLTFKQFFWLVGAGGVCVIWYYTLPFTFFATLSLITFASAAVLAFVKIDGASLIKVFLHIMGFTMGQKTYTWKKKENAYPFKIQKTKQLEAINEPAPMPRIQPSKISDVKKLIETKR